jgi:hypothetical protein
MPSNDYFDALAWAMRQQQHMPGNQPSYGYHTPRLFVKARLKKALELHQKMIVFRFLFNLQICKNVYYNEVER